MASEGHLSLSSYRAAIGLFIGSSDTLSCAPAASCPAPQYPPQTKAVPSIPRAYENAANGEVALRRNPVLIQRQAVLLLASDVFFSAYEGWDAGVRIFRVG